MSDRYEAYSVPPLILHVRGKGSEVNRNEGASLETEGEAEPLGSPDARLRQAAVHAGRVACDGAAQGRSISTPARLRNTCKSAFRQSQDERKGLRDGGLSALRALRARRPRSGRPFIKHFLISLPHIARSVALFVHGTPPDACGGMTATAACRSVPRADVSNRGSSKPPSGGDSVSGLHIRSQTFDNRLARRQCRPRPRRLFAVHFHKCIVRAFRAGRALGLSSGKELT